ncbi:MAG: hypothetical protein KF872_08815 [Chitinophagales bacterium]|nr:hypothetical protein [Chitinophagales bacterium]
MRKRWVLGSLAIVYGLAIVFLHDWFVQLSIKVMNHFSLLVYNVLVRNFSLAIGALVLGFCSWKVFLNKRFDLLFFLFILLALLVLHWLFLFEMNIEIIHALEFGLLALLLYGATCNAGAAVILCLPFMLIDEWVQYSLLYGNYNKYYEFNDLVLDILGAGLAILVLKIIEKERKTVLLPFWKRNEYRVLFVLLIFFCVLVLSGVLAAHQSQVNTYTIFTLSRIDAPELFWQTHAFTGAKYHILAPLPGAFIMFVLCVLLGCIDYSFIQKRPKDRHLK